MLDYFVSSDFIYHAMHSLRACRIGPQSAIECIDEFRKIFVNYTDTLESAAKFIFKLNVADWLNALVLPYNCVD